MSRRNWLMIGEASNVELPRSQLVRNVTSGADPDPRRGTKAAELITEASRANVILTMSIPQRYGIAQSVCRSRLAELGMLQYLKGWFLFESPA